MRIVTALQGTTTATGTETTEIATAVGTETEETVTGIVMAAAGAGPGEMTDVSHLERDIVAALEIMMTIRDVLPIMKMTGAGTSGTTAVVEAIAEVAEEGGVVVAVVVVALLETVKTTAVVVRVAASAKKTVWALRKEDRRPPKVPCLCRKEGGKHLAGMSTHPGTSSTLQAKQSRQVGLHSNYHPYLELTVTCTSGLFNLPGANRTQVPPILGIAGLPPPMPVQSFGMGIGGNPNLSRQSRRLYIGSITPDINEQNLADFFNGKMIEMSIGTGAPGNPVLAVQCNYEKNYAFVEVRYLVSASTYLL